MSRRRSQLSKILRTADRMERKQAARERVGAIKGETDEQQLARKVRDLEGFVNMMTERQVEDAVMKAVNTEEVILNGNGSDQEPNDNEKENTSDATE